MSRGAVASRVAFDDDYVRLRHSMATSTDTDHGESWWRTTWSLVEAPATGDLATFWSTRHHNPLGYPICSLLNMP
jgi:hypothetical protein